MGTSNIISAKARLAEKIQIKETIAVFGAAVILPIIFHLLPNINGTPLGKYALPIFYAPFIAVLFFRFHTALIASLLAPLANYLITGNPAFEIVQLITLELTLFVAAAYLLKRLNRVKYAVAPLSYLLSTVAVYILTSTGVIGWQIKSGYLINSVTTALPGILILTLLNVVMIKSKQV
ncbi:hypothetical protein ACSSWA_07670 [Melioribacter sp. Ez-97]|uniref:hypothetical protein n=1 Tax=Melioribacter sp. Ez-97 TaxID=3423434 RepID=UPI003ED9FF8A